jgi:hypothetical protein
MDMEELFDRICQHFIIYKREYFEIFAHQDHLTAMEGWVRGEIVWLMHQPPLKEQHIFQATGISVGKDKTDGTGNKGPHPDLHLKFPDTSDTIYVELKTIVIVIDSNGWDGTLVRQLKTEYNRFFPEDLLSIPSDWFISFTYPLDKNNRNRWEKIVNKAGLCDYYVKEESFDIGNNQQCLISLFRRIEREALDAT